MIEGFSINGLWPAGLPVAIAVVLLTILAVRVFGGGSKRHDPSHQEDHQAAIARTIRDRRSRIGISEPGRPPKTSHPPRGKNENRVLGRPTPASGSGAASTMPMLSQSRQFSGGHEQNQGKAHVS